MRTEIIGSSDELDVLAPAWHRLAEVCALTPFQTFQWTRSWWSLVGERDSRLQLHVVVMSRGDRICAIAPLMLRREGSDVVLVFATDPWADYLDVLVDPRLVDPGSAYRALGKHLTSGLGKSWSKVVLDEVPAWSGLALPEEIGARTEAASSCPRLLLDEATKVEALSTGRSEHTAKRRRLARHGRLIFVLHTEPDVIKERMPVFMAMHLRQWVTRPDRGITFDDPDVVRFYFGMVGRLASAGLLALAELLFNDKALALHLGFSYRSTFWGYRTTYDVDAKRYSPGHLLHQSLISELSHAGFQVLDFMRGDFGYKRAYTNRLLVNHRVVISTDL